MLSSTLGNLLAILFVAYVIAFVIMAWIDTR
jgi:hypothetical protein